MKQQRQRQNYLLVSLPALLCAFATGCGPYNDYTVELKPKGDIIERTLIFYRTDGNNSNGVPKYEAFPTNELAAITRAYSNGLVKQDGQRHIASGDFGTVLPKDVGGAGSYTNFATSLGEAGFYLERFRGNDDLAAKTARQFRAADQITDLVIGWTQTEFGRERGYKKLKEFLDEDFRRDLKNAGRYFQIGAEASLSDTNAPENFVARFCQYLYERGYLKLSDLPELYLTLEGGEDGSRILRLVQRLVVEKMGISASEPLPKSLTILNDPTRLETSVDRYLAGTDLYRAKVKEWERKKETDPKLAAPKPLDVTADLFADLFGGFGGGGETDHLTVKLALNHAPAHTNGKWQDGQVVWTDRLEGNRPLPVFCYARWSDPDVKFQRVHFGRVILEGDELTEYCLWQRNLPDKQSHEWESFLVGLQPGQELENKLENFVSSIEPMSEAAKEKQSQLDIGPTLLIEALKSRLEQRLKVGMTKDEVRAALGDPAGNSVNSDGLESWNYNDNAKAWIPFYAVGGGKFQNLVVNFDKDGKVKDWSSSKQGVY